MIFFDAVLKNTKPNGIDSIGFDVFCGVLMLYVAEREGFEPSVPFPVRQFSKLFLSATQASLQNPLFFGSANVEKDFILMGLW